MPVGSQFPIGFALAVDGTGAAEGHIFGVLRKDDMMTVCVALHRRARMVVVIVEGLAAEKDAPCLKVEGDSALEFETTNEEGSGWRIDQPSAGLEGLVDGALNGLRIQRLAIRLCAVVKDALCRAEWSS
jgi:hypothetical protein